ncbi:hypothetical protein LJB71_08240 [Thermomonas sp. S9]|uniref:hypothetical protein n=1 Tax=Thermomonas sp. S9 TaxID=2885203 RepID=UPI00216B3C38|nr:hypothetical protein [Thermomonas sp. S9]MCR6496204.1 hypothetical protein [Thermomonas sp. S9]
MADSYTKLFRGITASTIVSEPLATRWLWVTMLALADKSGNVWGSVPGLARLANISIAECEAALETLQAPDPYSRTRDHDGRRIAAIDGGWHLLNHAKYDAVRSAEDRREYKREWDRKHRPSGHARAKQSDSPTQSDNSPTKSDSPAPPTPTPTPTPYIAVGKTLATPAAAPRAGGDDTPLEGAFEEHHERPVAPNPVAPFAVALNRAGFRCTAMNPDLVAFVREGGTVEHLQSCAALPDCVGKPAVYVIRIARRELAQQAAPIPHGGIAHEAPRRLSAVDRIEANIARNRQQRAQDEQGGGDVIEGECHVVPR